MEKSREYRYLFGFSPLGRGMIQSCDILYEGTIVCYCMIQEDVPVGWSRF